MYCTKVIKTDQHNHTPVPQTNRIGYIYYNTTNKNFIFSNIQFIIWIETCTHCKNLLYYMPINNDDDVRWRGETGCKTFTPPQTWWWEGTFYQC